MYRFFLLFKLPNRENVMITFFQEKTKLENKQIVKLIRGCPYYEEWPTLSIHELVLLVKWKRFPRGHGEFNAIFLLFFYT